MGQSKPPSELQFHRKDEVLLVFFYERNLEFLNW